MIRAICHPADNVFCLKFDATLLVQRGWRSEHCRYGPTWMDQRGDRRIPSTHRSGTSFSI